MDRPTLPETRNPYIPRIVRSGVPSVKYQVLTVAGKDILVGRMKIDTPTPTGHAFILRRFDTGAVSLTTMFRAAFPEALESQEKEEIQWVRQNFDLTGNNGSSKDTQITRLAGIWVDSQLALQLGQEYQLGTVMSAVIEAQPDPDANYRRSNREAGSSNNTPGRTASRAAANQSPTAAPSPKRRKESSPVPELPRRSLRSTTSPPPRAAVPRSARKPPSRRTPGLSDSDRKPEIALAPIVDDSPLDEGLNAVANAVQSELYDQDIAEQKAMIEEMKANRLGDGSTKTKRERDEEKPAFNFAAKREQVTERTISTNKRVTTGGLGPQAKSAAWGVAAFAFAASAIAFLPDLSAFAGY